MGRFFQAQPIELSKDNIYQPPLELMMAANQYKNQEIQQTGDNAQVLLDSLDFRHNQIDNENTKNITKEISDKVNNAVEIFNKDLSSPEARKMLSSLKDEIKTRYNSGDIYNIQKTNDNLNAFEKQMDDAKLSELDKERHRAYFNNWAKENPTGSLKNFFSPGNIVEDKDTLTEYTKFHNANKADIETKTRETIGARWNTLTDNQKETLVFENGYRDFINATPELKDMLKTQMNSGLFNDRNIKFDSKDNLDMTQGFGLQMLPSTKALDYTRELKDSITKSVNPYENIDYERKYRANQDRLKKSEELGGLQLETNARTFQQLDIINQDFSKNLNDFMINELKLKPIYNKIRNQNVFTPEQGRNEIKRLQKTTKDPQILKILNNKLQKLEDIADTYRTKASNVSWNGAAAILGIEPAIQVKKDYEARYGTDPESMYSIKMNEFNINGKKYNNLSFNDIIKTPEKYGLPPEMFYTVENKGTKTETRTLLSGMSTMYNAKSSIPAVYSATDMNVNDMLFDFNNSGNSIQAKADFNKLGLSIQ